MRRFRDSCLLLLILGTMAFSYIPPLYGQAVTGYIKGYVTDPSGAGIVGATVTATEVRTNIRTTRITDETGMYLITNLLPGTYTVTVEAKGFKTFTQQGLRLEVGHPGQTR